MTFFHATYEETPERKGAANGQQGSEILADPRQMRHGKPPGESSWPPSSGGSSTPRRWMPVWFRQGIRPPPGSFLPWYLCGRQQVPVSCSADANVIGTAERARNVYVLGSGQRKPYNLRFIGRANSIATSSCYRTPYKSRLAKPRVAARVDPGTKLIIHAFLQSCFD